MWGILILAGATLTLALAGFRRFATARAFFLKGHLWSSYALNRPSESFEQAAPRAFSNHPAIASGRQSNSGT